MDKMTVETTFFRNKPVHFQKEVTANPFFRSISVQLNDGIGIFPLHIRSFHASIDSDGKVVFRTIPVHFYVFFSYLCTGKSVNTSTDMAGTVKEMSLIKQVLQLKQLGESNRGIARRLPINKETVNGYMNTIDANGWDIGELLKIDDPELERMFHAGSPAYTDARMKEFLRLLPYFREQLTNRKLHVTRQLLWEEYRHTHPDGYGKSQFYDHLKQNLVAQKDITTVLAQTYKPGEKLMIDFAGDKLSYIDTETGEIMKVEVFVACMPYSDYIYVICVPSQRTEDFLFALRMCLEHLGGVPPIVVPDNLKAAVITPDRHEPELNTALRDMGNHYHFTVLPCDPASPTQKALVEDAVRIAYNRIAAKLRGREFHSLLELNAGVEEQNILLNQTRMQKRPYTREERFHAMEKPLLQPLPEEVFEMRYYADLKVGSNNFVELRHDKVTHFYSAPYIYIGRMARVIFTRSWVKIYVDNQLVATHTRKHDYGHTYEPEHMASNSRAIMERSAAYYVSWAGKKSEECKAYISEIFNPQRTNKPEEVYYRLCGAILSSYKKYESSLVDLTCRQCLDNRVFTYKKFEAILKHNYITQSDDEPCLFAPVPTNHANMRGSDYFK
jgi:transposase